MTKLTFDEVKKVYSQFQDKNELSVGYERTYDTVYGWLTNPAELKGLGFDPTFAARVMASVAILALYLFQLEELFALLL